MKSFDGWVRRIDLALRAECPFLETIICKVSNTEYYIVASNYCGEFKELETIFNRIRFCGTPVRLSQYEPKMPHEIIPCIADDQIPSKFEGLPFGIMADLKNHIECKHPGFMVADIVDDSELHRDIFRIQLKGSVKEEDKNNILKTLQELNQPWEFVVENGGETKNWAKQEPWPFFVPSASSWGDRNTAYFQRDETLWFDNVEGIYSGSFTKEDLFFYNSSKTSCLVNFSLHRNINIRNHLLLYDVIYCLLPSYSCMREFCEYQKVTKNEVLELVQRGRIKILMMEVETNYDIGFFNDIYNMDNNAMITRRAVGMLCAADIVSIYKSYIFTNPSTRELFNSKLRPICNNNGYDFEKLARFILWPITALRQSFHLLNYSTSKGIMKYGVNSIIVENMTDPVRKNSELEFQFFSEAVHIAHALDATYFPFFTDDKKFSDHPYASMMGQLLAFYKDSSVDDFSNNFLSGGKVNPGFELLEIFEIDEFIPILEFEKEVSSTFIRNGLRSLFSELSYMDNDSMRCRINEYNQKVQKLVGDKKGHSCLLDLASDGAGLLGLTMPPLASLKRLGSWILENMPDLRESLIEVEMSFKDRPKQQISLLSKISRVARLRQNYSS